MFNTTLDTALTVLFAGLIVIVLADALRVWIAVLRGRRLPTGKEDPYVESKLWAPAGLIRVRASGRLNKTFSGDGIRVLRFGGRSSQAFDVAVDEHGRAVVTGYTQGRKTNEDVAVARVR